MNKTEVKTMLVLFVPESHSTEWANQQMTAGGFDKSREIMAISAFEGESDDCFGMWLMQEVISRIH